ncbi:DUF1622 domain-containing protein [Candidatus Dependentiae bacterium]|nr:DUF1622 domain-containing protein [Candidatus Dependentiae bacterium]
MESLLTILSTIKTCFELLGVFIVIIGTVQALYYWLQTVWAPTNTHAYFLFRSILGKAIIGALEVFVAADLVATIIHTDFHSLAIIFLLVILRVMLAFFLHKELQGLAQ